MNSYRDIVANYAVFDTTVTLSAFGQRATLAVFLCLGVVQNDYSWASTVSARLLKKRDAD